MRISRNIKDALIHYVREYAKRVDESADPIRTMNSFEPKLAAQAVLKTLSKAETVTEADLETVKSQEFNEYLITFFYEKLPINYLVLKREVTYYEAKKLLNDKGLNFFPELKGVVNPYYKDRCNDYPATEKQLSYIKDFNVNLQHVEELSGREASLIISCLKRPSKTKPAYYSYYIK